MVSDHKALVTVLMGNKNKTYSSRLTHAPARTNGIAYLSRHPLQLVGEKVKATEQWKNWFNVNHVKKVNSILAEEFNGPIRLTMEEIET